MPGHALLKALAATLALSLVLPGAVICGRGRGGRGTAGWQTCGANCKGLLRPRRGGVHVRAQFNRDSMQNTNALPLQSNVHITVSLL